VQKGVQKVDNPEDKIKFVIEKQESRYIVDNDTIYGNDFMAGRLLN